MESGQYDKVTADPSQCNQSNVNSLGPVMLQQEVEIDNTGQVDNLRRTSGQKTHATNKRSASDEQQKKPPKRCWK